MAGNDPGTFINQQDVEPNVSMATQKVDQPALVPVAANTPLRYSPPAAQKNDNLEQLARGLSNFDAGLSSYMEGRDQQTQQRDTAQAQADFAKNHQADYADAVKSGTIPASASPTYITAYKEAQGQLYGMNLEQKFQSAYDQWPGKSNLDDKDAYSKFAQDFFARNIATNDPDVLRGLMPVVHQISEQGLRQNIEGQHTQVTQGYADTMSATVNNKIAQGVGYANTSGNPVDPSWVAKQVGDAYSGALGVGVKPEEAQRNAIVQITTAALLNKAGHGAEILQSLDVPLPGSNIILSQTPYGAEAKVRIQNELDTYAREQALHGAQAQKAADKQALGTVEQRVIDGLVKDPSGPVNEADLKEGEKYDPTFRVRALDWQDKVFKNGGTSDPTALMQLHRDIMAGAGMDSVTHAVEMGSIRNPRDLKAAQEEVLEHQKADPVMSTLAQSEAYKAVMASIKSSTATGVADPFGTKGITPAGLNIQFELNKRMQSWAAENPSATYNQTQDQLGKTAADVMKLIHEGGAGGGEIELQPNNPYNAAVPTTQRFQPLPSSTPASTGTQPTSPNAAAPVPQPGATPPPSPMSPQGANPPPDPKAVQAWVNTLSQNDQAALARVAMRRGQDPQQLLMQAYQHAQSKGLLPAAPPTISPSGGAGSGTASGPFGNVQDTPSHLDTQPQYQQGAAEKFGDAVAKWQASDPRAPAIIHQLTGVLQGLHSALPYQGSTTLAAIKDNPQAAHLLDFVAGPESRGNYNAYYGHGDNQSVNLTGMTLNDVLQFQHNLVSVDGAKSSAAGRYQFMPKTLQGLMGQMGLNGSERFTPELQDNLALQLLKNRGLEQWQKGTLDDATFMNNIAYEWASLPNPHTGASQYGGDGLNRALVTPGQVQQTLNEARGLGTTGGAPSPSTTAPTTSSSPTSGSSGTGLENTILGKFANGVFGGPQAPAAPAAPVPPAPAPAPQANTDKADFVIGDSVGDGVRAAMKAEGDTQVSRPPSQVLARITALPTGSLAGRKTVVLSTGLSNNSSENPATVEKQIQGLIAKGAAPGSIVVLGVGDRADYKANGLNDKIAAAASKFGARFVPLGQLPNGEHVHPDLKGYADIATRARANYARTGDDVANNED